MKYLLHKYNSLLLLLLLLLLLFCRHPDRALLKRQQGVVHSYSEKGFGIAAYLRHTVSGT